MSIPASLSPDIKHRILAMRVTLQKRAGKVPSLAGARCAVFLQSLFDGFHHLPPTIRVEKIDWTGTSIIVDLPRDFGAATYDRGGLTLLTTLAHQQLVRAALTPTGEGVMTLTLEPRAALDSVSGDGHPSASDLIDGLDADGVWLASRLDSALTARSKNEVLDAVAAADFELLAWLYHTRKAFDGWAGERLVELLAACWVASERSNNPFKSDRQDAAEFFQEEWRANGVTSDDEYWRAVVSRIESEVSRG